MTKIVNYFLLIFLSNLVTFAQAQVKVSKRPFVIGISKEFEYLNPIISKMPATQFILGFTSRSLLGLDQRFKPVPFLLKDVPQKDQIVLGGEGSLQRMHILCELKEEAKWGDGTQLTGHDVVFTWQVAMSDMLMSSNRQIWESIESITVNPQNIKQFKITLYRPDWAYIQKLAQIHLIPKHKEEIIFSQFGQKSEGYERNSHYRAKPLDSAIYNGPYKVVDIKLGNYIHLVVNPNFYGAKPQIDEIIIRLIPSQSKLEDQLLTQEIDFIAPSQLGLPIDRAILLEQSIKAKNLPYTVSFIPNLIYEQIAINLNHPILKDIKVRQALVYGLDRQKLINHFYAGKYQKALHYISMIDPWFSNDPSYVTDYEYSLEKANHLLDEAGWSKRKNGPRYKLNEKLSLHLVTNEDDPLRKKILHFVREDWEKIGVELMINTEPSRLFFGETVKKAKFNSLALFAWQIYPEENPITLLHSRYIPANINGYTGRNTSSLHNSKIDALCDQMSIESDSKKRAQYALQILSLYTKELPAIPLYHRANYAIFSSNLAGVFVSGHFFYSSNFSENWTWREK